MKSTNTSGHPRIIDFQKEFTIHRINQNLKRIPLHLCRIVDHEVELAARRVVNRKSVYRRSIEFPRQARK